MEEWNLYKCVDTKLQNSPDGYVNCIVWCCLATKFLNLTQSGMVIMGVAVGC